MLLSMENNFISFINWLDGVMAEKNVTPTDIANTGFVSISAVSLLLSKTTKSASIEMCKAISKATGIPLITVYRKAGHLPADPLEDEWVEEQTHKIKLIPPSLRGAAGKVIDSMMEGDDTPQTNKEKPKGKTAKV